jgi:hypothetical protein
MIRSLRRGVVTSLCVCLTASVVAGAADEITISATAGGVVASQADGTAVWKVQFPDMDTPSWTSLPNGVIVLDSGVIVDASGRVLARRHDSRDWRERPGGGPRDGTCPYWSALAQITPPSGSGQSNQHNVPLFDSHGSAWVIVTHKDGSDYFLQVRRSNGHDGTWQPLETISDSTNYVSGPEGAIDPDDNITIVFRDISGGYKLYAMRYEPSVGWAGPDLVYSTPNFFQAIEAGADQEGNVAAVFDPQDSVWSTAYDAASGTWSAPGRVSPEGYSTLLPTVVQNRLGDGLYLIYMVRSGGPTGVYAHRFDSDAKAWGPAELLPGSSSVAFSGAGPASRFPAAVDRFGDATMLWQSSSPYTVYASRTQAGVWQPAYELLPPGPYGTDIENFSHVDASEFGDAFGVITRYEGGSNRFYAFRYRAGAGWDDPDNPYTSGMNVTTRSRICFYFGANAVGTLYGLVGGDDQLISLLYDGMSWSGELLDVPEEWPAFFQEIEPDRGEPLLVLEAEELFEPNYGIWATWLRNLPGDLDGDGQVGQSDLGILLASWRIDAGGDIDGDGDTDQSDLGILLSNWGETCP